MRRPTTFTLVPAWSIAQEEGPEDEFMVEGMIGYGASHIFVGPPKSGKSTFLLQLACAVANGEPFLGRDTIKGTVIYLQFDNSYKAWAKMLRDVKESGVYRADTPLYTLDEKSHRKFFDVLSQRGTEDVKAVLAKYKPVLVIMDTLKRIHTLNENHPQDMLKVHYGLETAFGHDTPGEGTAFISVHHASKVTKWVQHGRPEPGEAIRGSTGIAGDYDSVFFLWNNLLTIQSRLAWTEPLDLGRDHVTELFTSMDAIAYVGKKNTLISLREQFPHENFTDFWKKHIAPLGTKGLPRSTAGRVLKSKGLSLPLALRHIKPLL